MSGLLLLRRPSHVRCLSSRLSQVRHYALIGKPKASDEPRWVLPKTPARTRFAPSPTGYLHLGSLRTALYNYLLARATGGQFIIRLEDTDQARFVSDAEQVLYDDLRWAGLHWDEGPDKGGPFGPYKQSERLDLYKQHANLLLDSGHAFRCFCTKEDLEFNVQQATSSGAAAHYPGTCTHIEKGESERRAANGEPHVVRFKSAETPVPALDLVYGTYKKAEREDNFIIMKSDGFPTYHFANVVDDHFMEITHVVRGAEWLISTPKHVELYNALGWKPPSFAHVGLLVDAQRQKLSKRDMANIGIGVYRSNKVMSEALLNFSVLLGWDPNLQKNTHLNKRGVMNLKEMEQNFTLKFTRGDIIVDLSKLAFFQKRLTRSLITDENSDRAVLSKQILQPILSELKQVNQGLEEYQQGRISAESHLHELYGSIVPNEPGSLPSEDYVLQVLRAWKGSIDDPSHFVDDNIFAFFQPSKPAMRKKFDELQKYIARVMIVTSDRKSIINADISKVLKMFTHRLSRVEKEDWTAEKLGDIVKGLTDSVKFYDTRDKKDKYESAGWAFMRHALLNGKAGSSIVPLMLLFGQHETVVRIRNARKIATLEEDKMRRETQRIEESKKLLIFENRNEDGSLAPDRSDIELRNVVVLNPPTTKHSKAPLPSGEGAFSTYMEKEKGRGEPPQDGPFKSRPPMPAPMRPPKDPSEVERSPQFLSFSEFKTGTRRVDLAKEEVEELEVRGPAFCDLEELRRHQEAQSKNLQRPKKVQVDEAVENVEGAWAIPKPRLPRLQGGQTKSREVGPPKGQDASEAAAKRVEEPRSGMQTATGSAAGNTSSKPLKTGPFKVQAGNELPIDVEEHVKHIRALNRSLALRRAKTKRQEARGEEATEMSRLMQLKTTGRSPMSRNSIIGKEPQGPMASNTVEAWQDAYDGGDQATASVQKQIYKIDDAWGTGLGLDYYGKGRTAAPRKAKARAVKEDEASLAEIEQQMARQWADRNE